MNDWLSTWTSLPNLHPALVHFPIALAPVAVLFDVASAVRFRTRSWLDQAATSLWVLAAVGAGAAYSSPKPRAASVVPQETVKPDAAETGGASVRPDGSNPMDRLERTPDGTITWRPRADDRGAIGTVLEPLGERDGAVWWIEPDEPSPPGLELGVEGKSLLVLPGQFSDVQVTVRLAPESFEGELGLLHHAQGPGHLGLLAVRWPEGRFRLISSNGESDHSVLDEASVDLPDRAVELAVSAAGRHLRGTLDGELVVHGHASPLPEGRVGLLFDGRGRVQILEIEVTPISH